MVADPGCAGSVEPIPVGPGRAAHASDRRRSVLRSTVNARRRRPFARRLRDRLDGVRSAPRTSVHLRPSTARRDQDLEADPARVIGFECCGRRRRRRRRSRRRRQRRLRRAGPRPGAAVMAPNTAHAVPPRPRRRPPAPQPAQHDAAAAAARRRRPLAGRPRPRRAPPARPRRARPGPRRPRRGGARRRHATSPSTRTARRPGPRRRSRPTRSPSRGPPHRTSARRPPALGHPDVSRSATRRRHVRVGWRGAGRFPLPPARFRLRAPRPPGPRRGRAAPDRRGGHLGGRLVAADRQRRSGHRREPGCAATARPRSGSPRAAQPDQLAGRVGAADRRPAAADRADRQRGDER